MVSKREGAWKSACSFDAWRARLWLTRNYRSESLHLSFLPQTFFHWSVLVLTTFYVSVAFDLGTTSFFDPFFPYCHVTSLHRFSMFLSDHPLVPLPPFFFLSLPLSLSLLLSQFFLLYLLLKRWCSSRFCSLPFPLTLDFLSEKSCLLQRLQSSFYMLITPQTITLPLVPALLSFVSAAFSPQGILTSATLRHFYPYLCRASWILDIST